MRTDDPAAALDEPLRGLDPRHSDRPTFFPIAVWLQMSSHASELAQFVDDFAPGDVHLYRIDLTTATCD